jgi:hypothetical protein
MSDVTTDLMNGSMIAEIRARGCTTPGVAEAIVEHHGAVLVSQNLHRVEELGNECASSDTETGAKMRLLLHGAAGISGRAASDSVLDETSKPSEAQSLADSTTAPAEASVDAGASTVETETQNAPAGNLDTQTKADEAAVIISPSPLARLAGP